MFTVVDVNDFALKPLTKNSRPRAAVGFSGITLRRIFSERKKCFPDHSVFAKELSSAETLSVVNGVPATQQTAVVLRRKKSFMTFFNPLPSMTFAVPW